MTRAQARVRVLTTLRFLRDAQQDTSPDQATGYQGFFYHFVNFTTGKRYGDSELSTVDTALLMAGVLFTGGYFDQDHPEEKEIRKIADELYQRVNWPWAIAIAPDIRMAWSPELEFGGHDWRGYNEAMLVFILALGSPTFPAARSTLGRAGPPTTTAPGARSKDRRTSRSGRCSATSTRTSGSTCAASRTSSCGRRTSTTSRTAGAPCSRSAPMPSAIPWTGAATGPTSGDSRPATGPGDFEFPYLGQKRKFFSLRGARRGTHRDARRRHRRAHRGAGLAAVRAGSGAARRAGDAQALRPLYLRQVRLRRRVQPELRLRRAAAARHAAYAAWAGWTPSTSASTRARSSR